MPELPEVETVAHALNKAIQGKLLRTANSYSRLRKPFECKRIVRELAGKQCITVWRRGKYIIMEFDCDFVLIAHLGMTGAFHIENARQKPDRHDRAALIFADGNALRFKDARRFGFISLAKIPHRGAMPKELDSLGLEPLEPEFTAKAMQERANGRTVPVKTFIMDQKVVAGVGNIYASEALFLAGVHPARRSGTITGNEWKKLVPAIKKVLRQAIKAGGSTIRNYQTVDGSEGGFQQRLRVYGKKGEGCERCAGTITVARMAGRSTFFCPECQK